MRSCNDFTVDCCCPGDMVTITAIVKATGCHGGRSSKDCCTFLLYLHAISVSNDKLLAGGDSSPASLHVEFSTKVKSYNIVNQSYLVTCWLNILYCKCENVAVYASHFGLSVWDI